MLGYKVAKSDSEKVIVTLEIPEDAITNMIRKDIVDVSKATHRTNKAKVLVIEDLQGNTFNTAKSYNYKKQSLVYEVGKTICVEHFDTKIDEICSTGIHFFLDKDLAKMFDYKWFVDHTVLNGPYKRFYDNGRLWQYAEYKDGLLHGECISYHPNGEFRDSCKYIAGKKEGTCIKYDYDGDIIEESTYKNGKLNGISKQYYYDPDMGRVNVEYDFKDGIKYGYNTVIDSRGNIIKQYSYSMDSRGIIYIDYNKEFAL